MNSDGFDGFFRAEWSSVYAPILVESLERIGCSLTAAIARDAVAASAIAGTKKRDRKLNRCDQRFCAYPDGDIAEALLTFIRSHKKAIRLVHSR